jgi:GNAT superfamily N-acetyltransferase
MNYTITRHDRADDSEALKLVDDGIGDYNESAAPELANVCHLSVFARDASGHAVAGAVGRTWGTNAELQQIWMPETLRKQRIGQRLLAAFEHAAKARGCALIYLETWSFQARGFYEKCGYSVALEISGYAPGYAKFTMTKQLS